MNTTLDSFIEWLATSLDGSPQVHWVRSTPNDESTGLPQHNALNVTMLSAYEVESEEAVLVSLDLLGDDTRTVMQWAKRVRDALLAQQYIPELDYETTPDTPAATGRMVFWDRDSVNFEFVFFRTSRRLLPHFASGSDRYVHLNCSIPLRHVRE